MARPQLSEPASPAVATDPNLSIGADELAHLEQVDYEVSPSIELHDSMALSAACDCSACVAAWPQFYVRAEYLAWSTKAMDVPPLVTTSPDGTLQSDAGVLGRAGTSILVGNAGANDNSRSGGRITFGMRLNRANAQFLDISFFGLDTESQTFTASDNNFSILARPFFNVNNDAQDARLIAFPNLTAGSVSVNLSTEFQGGEVTLRRASLHPCVPGLSIHVGYRYAELEDSLAVTESTLSLSGPTAGASFDLLDQFDTRNRFHGGKLGMKYVGQWGNGWSAALATSIALGNTRAEARVFGQTTTTAATGGTNTTSGGLLSQSTNIGDYEGDESSTISDIGLTLRKQITCRLAATIGYEFVYWSDVLRASEQVDLGINTTQIPPGTLIGEPRPAFPLNVSDFWAQGLHFGIEYEF